MNIANVQVPTFSRSLSMKLGLLDLASKGDDRSNFVLKVHLLHAYLHTYTNKVNYYSTIKLELLVMRDLFQQSALYGVWVSL